MTAKADLTTVSNLSTFGNWKDLTNDILGVAKISVTLGDNETNTGNIVLNGNLTLANSRKIKTDIISSTDNANYLLLDKNNVIITGEDSKLQITGSDDSSNDTTEATLQFSTGVPGGFTDTLFVKTNALHTELEIGSSTKSFKIHKTTGVISSSNGAKVSSDMIADALNGINIGQTTAGLGKFTKLECTGTGGNGILDNVAIGTNTPSTIKGTKIDIDPDPNDNLSQSAINALTGAIDNTAIGTNIPRSGNFTSISTTSGVSGLNGTLGFGDVYTQDGNDKVVDTATNPPTFNGQATSLTTPGIVTLLETIYPVGALYITTDNRDPSVILPWGASNWERYGQGKTLLGWDTGKGIVSITYINATQDYSIVLQNSSHGIKPTEAIEVNMNSGVNISQHGILIAQGHNATVKSVAGATIVVALSGNPIPAGGLNRNFDIPSSSTVVHKGFGTAGHIGGAVSHTLTTEQVPDHVHDNKAWHGEQFYLYNDANHPTSLQGTQRAQGPNQNSDAHLYAYSGGVYGYEDSNGVTEVEVGKPHNSCMPFITTYMWKRVP